MTTETMTFAQMGFDATVAEKSATPAVDGYDATLGGYPYHIDPTATPDAFAALQAAITDNQVTVVPYSAPVLTLAQAQAVQIAAVTAAYNAAIQTAVSFTTAGGVTKTFQADSGSQETLSLAANGYNFAGAVPAGFYWKSEDNTEVPFALADLKGLYAAMLAQGWAAFQQLQTLKSQVNAATSVSAVQTVVWS
ncbi:uncharacterized protein DUF4376 [Paraburkholderia caballeronis]|uniref:DUF4376 domain-containing protein n=1 Tax=Paraburkholderia caballeronis TaxID=416943 RepID=UPI001065A7B8|nr:DUF4376 domain-containing protein [Paraburkholderia caballeronis]TDV39515.1 uncharacterized protein DUF4376 [Paraburkholderia caballeronis]